MALKTTPGDPRIPHERLGRALKAMPGEPLCGDQMGCWVGTEWLRLALADGLGHGREAHAAASAAMRQIAIGIELGLDALFARSDQALISTRGVALSVVDIIFRENVIVHASVGNVRTFLLQRGSLKRLAGARGIVGAGFSELRPERLAIEPGDWLALFSDGIPEGAAIADALGDVHASDQLAERQLDQWAHDRDDAALLIYRHE